jgi:hypothetical protein|nr:MAG TPA: hypothetical protein [Caudoviricetes sp.]
MPTELNLKPGSLLSLRVASSSGGELHVPEARIASVTPVVRSGEPLRYKVVVEPLPVFRGYGYAIDPLEYRIRREEMRGVPWMLAQLRYNEDSLSIRQLAYRYARSGQPHYGRTPLIEGDKKIYAILKIDRVVEERCSPLPESRVVTNKVFRFDVARAPRRAETFLSPLDEHHYPEVRSTSYEALLGKEFEIPDWYPMRVVLVLPKSASCPLGCVLVEFQK